jgi:hypothetical protein
MAAPVERSDLLCPSAPESLAGARVIGIVQGTSDRPHVDLLREPIPLTSELLQQVAPVQPGEVFRIAGNCAGSACKHYAGKSCTLATRIVRLLPEVVERLPVCAIRQSCRWFDQEGAAACRRCPQVVRDSWPYTPGLAEAADPTVPAPNIRSAAPSE